MYAEVQQCVRQLEKSIGEIERGVRKAERELETGCTREDSRIARAPTWPWRGYGLYTASHVPAMSPRPCRCCSSASSCKRCVRSRPRSACGAVGRRRGGAARGDHRRYVARRGVRPRHRRLSVRPDGRSPRPRRRVDHRGVPRPPAWGAPRLNAVGVRRPWQHDTRAASTRGCGPDEFRARTHTGQRPRRGS
jgi:hypothetical protein